MTDVTRTATRRIIPLYMLFVFLSNFTTVMCFLTLFLSEAGFSVGTISLGILVYHGCKFVLEVPSGLMSDRLGHKAVGMLGIVLMAGYYVALLLARDFPGLVLAFVLQGFGVSCLSGSFEAIYLANVEPSRLVRLNSIEQATFFASYGLSALLGGLLAQAGAFDVSLAVDIAAACLTMLACVWFPRDAYGGGAAGSPDGARARGWGGARGFLRALAGSPLLCRLLLMDLSQALFYVGFEDFYSLVLDSDGLPATWTGISFAAELALSVAVVLLVPWPSSRTGERRLFVGSFVVRAALTLLFLLPGMRAWALPLLYVSQSVVYCLGSPLRRKVFQRCLPEGYRAATLSAQSQAISLGAIVFSALSGLLSARIGLWGVLLVAFVAYAVVYGRCTAYLCSHWGDEG